MVKCIEPSCWGLDGKNIMAIKKCKVKEWTDRMNVLNNLG